MIRGGSLVSYNLITFNFYFILHTLMKKTYSAPQLLVVEMGDHLQPLCVSATIQYDENATTGSALSTGSNPWDNSSWKKADDDDDED